MSNQLFCVFFFWLSIFNFWNILENLTLTQEFVHLFQNENFIQKDFFLFCEESMESVLADLSTHQFIFVVWRVRKEEDNFIKEWIFVNLFEWFGRVVFWDNVLNV